MIIGVVIIAAIIVFPLQKKIKLGLDLKGGAHIVLQAKDIAGASQTGATSTENAETEAAVADRLVSVLRNRIDQYGIAEPLIQREGTDRVTVDLPGVKDPDAALELIGRTAVLEFQQVLGSTPGVSPKPNRENYDSDADFAKAMSYWEQEKKKADEYAETVAKDAASKPGVRVGRDNEGRTYLLGKVYLTGNDLADAKFTQDQVGKPAVSLRFNKAGAERFAEATEQNVNKQIAIVLDGTVVSAPVVRQKILGGEAQISGNFTVDEATQLSIMLRAGALPVKVEVLENRSVGPSLGADSIKSGVLAGLIGVVLVTVFMLLFYRSLGLAAIMAMGISMLMLLAGMVLMNTTLTLPGIGGVILTIGMAVDGNILIYERMKEEYRSGKTIMAALDSGFSRAKIVILDSNITTLIASAVLFYFGAGPVRGFAVTLSLGVLTSMFGNLVVTRTLLQIMLRHRKSMTI